MFYLLAHFDFSEVDIEAQFSINQSRADEITMREDYGTLPMQIHDDGFGDIGFDTDPQDLARDGMDPNMDDNLFGENLNSKEPLPGTSRSVLDSIDHHHPMDDDGFGDDFGQPAAGLFEGDIFADAPMQSENLPAGAIASQSDSDDDMDHFDGGAPSPEPTSDNSRPASRLGDAAGAMLSPGAGPASPSGVNQNSYLAAGAGSSQMGTKQGEGAQPGAGGEEEEESFALAPVDVTAIRGVSKAKRKRKLIVDEVKNISGEEMRNQLSYTSDIVTTLDLAPPTKRLMFWKETGGVEKLFGLPLRDIPARCLSQNYQRNLTSRTIDLEDFSVLGPADVLALEYQRPERPESPIGKRGRKRKQPPPVVVEQEASLPEPDFVRDQSEFINDGLELRHSSVLEASEALMPPPQTPSIHHLQHASSPGLSLASANDLLPSGMTPAGLCHGGMTPHHAIESMESIPNLPADQVSAVLNGGLDSLGYSAFESGHHSPGNLSDRVADWGDDYDHIPMAAGPVRIFSLTIYFRPIQNEKRIFKCYLISLDKCNIKNLLIRFINLQNSMRILNWIYNLSRILLNSYILTEFRILQGEEQFEDETDEQFEERVLNKRAAQLFYVVRNRLIKQNSLLLSDLTYRNVKKHVSCY